MIKQNLLKNEEAVFEKRHWVRLTRSCNNDCLFCLDSSMKNGTILPLAKIKRNILAGLKKSDRLILSGGEPTIHPDYLEIIKYAKQLGYKKIQTITNGRMFSYSNFARQAVDNGLDEITISIHGHNSKLHDSLVGMPGAFKQTIKGLDNLLKLRRTKKIIINIDVVINKQNYRYLDKIISFFYRMGITEFDLLQITPAGKAYKNADLLFYDLDDAQKYFQKTFNKFKDKDIVIWTNRFPVNYLENYEFLIQDPHKLYSEILGDRKNKFIRSLKLNKKIGCYGKRCQVCFLKNLCQALYELKAKMDKKAIKDLKINLDFVVLKDLDKNYGVFIKQAKNLYLKGSLNKILKFLQKPFNNINSFILDIDNLKPDLLRKISESLPIDKQARVILVIRDNYEQYNKQPFSYYFVLNKNFNKFNLSAANKNNIFLFLENHEKLNQVIDNYFDLKKLRRYKFKSIDLPQCLNLQGINKSFDFVNLAIINKRASINLEDFVSHYIENLYKTKSLRCKKCKYFKKCQGLQINYVRLTGYNILKPIYER